MARRYVYVTPRFPYPQPVAGLTIGASAIPCGEGHCRPTASDKRPAVINLMLRGRVGVSEGLALQYPPRLRLSAFKDSAHHCAAEYYWSFFWGIHPDVFRLFSTDAA